MRYFHKALQIWVPCEVGNGIMLYSLSSQHSQSFLQWNSFNRQSSVWSLIAGHAEDTGTEDWKGCLLEWLSLGCCLGNQLCRFIKLYRSSLLHYAILPRPCNPVQQYLTNIYLQIKPKIHNHVVTLKEKQKRTKLVHPTATCFKKGYGWPQSGWTNL